MKEINSKDILTKFKDFFLEKKYIELPEKKIVRNQKEETYFNMSAISANIDIFDNLHNANRINYFTKQQVYFSNKLDGVGENPLANPLEISLSIFRLKDDSPLNTIKDVLNYLSNLGFKTKDIYIRVANNKSLIESYEICGIDKKNIFIWDKLEKFNIGSHRPSGFYSYIYVKYKHGIVPLGSISFIPYQLHWYSDVAIFKERILMMLNNKMNIYETEFLCPIVSTLKELYEFDNNEVFRFAALLRALGFLVKDGLFIPSSSGQGHFLKRLMRELAFLLKGKYIHEEHYEMILLSLKQSLFSQGYTLKNEKEFIDVLKQISLYSKNIQREFTRIIKEIEIVGFLKPEKILEEKGIRSDWILCHREIPQHIKAQFEPFLKRRNSIRNLAFPFDSSQKIDIRKLLSE